MILVTGGTGLVGSHLLAHLAMQGKNIKAIHRPKSDLQAVKRVFAYYSAKFEQLFNSIIWVEADILDLPALHMAFDQIDTVYHCAALISLKENEYKVMRKINIEGTANIANLCIIKKVKKLCFVSSISAIGKAAKGQMINEDCEFNINEHTSGYAISKYGAETEVWRASQEGLDVIIVNPGIIIGAGFWKTGSGKLFSQINKGFRYYTKGKSGYVGVKDVVQIMLQLMQSPLKNERYILVSENASYQEVLNTIADALGKKRPDLKASPFVTSLVWRLGWLLNILFGIAPKLSRWSARASHKKSLYNNKKIKEVLAFTFEPLAVTIKTTAADFIKDQR